MERSITVTFNDEATLKELEAAAKVLGLPSWKEAFSHALSLLDVSKQAKEQGKELAVLTLKETGNQGESTNYTVAVDAIIKLLESRTGNVWMSYPQGSTFKLNKFKP